MFEINTTKYITSNYDNYKITEYSLTAISLWFLPTKVKKDITFAMQAMKK